MNVLLALQRRKGLGLLVAALVGASIVLFALAAPRSYTASAVVAVVPDPDTSPSGDLVRLAVPTYASLATSESLAASMAASSGESRRALESGIGAHVAPSTNTVLVTVRWGNAERAAELANGVVGELVEFSEQDPILTAFSVAPAVTPEVESFPPVRATLVGGTLVSIMAGILAAMGWDYYKVRVGTGRTGHPHRQGTSAVSG